MEVERNQCFGAFRSIMYSYRCDSFLNFNVAGHLEPVLEVAFNVVLQL